MSIETDPMEFARWATSAEGIAACREAYEFARRTGIRISLTETGALLAAAHMAELEAREALAAAPRPGPVPRP